MNGVRNSLAALICALACDTGAIASPGDAATEVVARRGRSRDERPEFRVNPTTAGHQFSPAVATNGNGDFVVTWVSSMSDPVPAPVGNCNISRGDVMARIYGRDGTPRGDAFRVSSDPATYCLEARDGPQAAVDASGRFVVVWHSDGADGDGDDVYAQRFSRTGERIGDAILVNTTTEGFQFYPMIAMDAGGDFVVTWFGHSHDFSQSTINGQRFSADGRRRGAELEISTDRTGPNHWSTVAMDKGGDFIVAWQSRPAGATVDVYAQRYDADGNTRGEQISVNTFRPAAQLWPVTAIDARGAFVVAWISNNQDGSGWGVYAQRFGPKGAPIGDEFQVPAVTTGDQDYPAVAASPGGDFVITWQSPNEDGSGIGVLAQRYDAEGGRVGMPFQVNTHTVGDQLRPAVAADGRGRAFVVWQSDGQDGHLGGVYAKVFSRP